MNSLKYRFMLLANPKSSEKGEEMMDLLLSLKG